MEDLDMADSSEYNALTLSNFTRHKGQIFRRLVLIEVVCHNADVGSNPGWSMWDYSCPRDSVFFRPKCFYFIIYQCSILEILIYNLSM